MVARPHGSTYRRHLTCTTSQALPETHLATSTMEGGEAIDEHVLSFCFCELKSYCFVWVSCHFRFRSVVDHTKPCFSMKMEVPGLADSLQQCLCVNSGIYAGDVLDTYPGWQQSKLIWALSAEVGSASRMHCTGLWHVKAAQQPFSLTTHTV